MIPPIKQTRRRTQRISSETPVIETLVVVEFLQAVPILNDAFRLRRVQRQQAQLGFENVQKAQGADYRRAKRVSRLRGALAVEVPAKRDASSCHAFSS
ncbi:MAG TPA: hypothetical protein PKA47_18530 [Accumulibacter sp.]|uniref:hypothetical protein n=1 Tax=Accumulibacter sp. TaxID=2053492 RepID=UPI002C7E5DFF|nr:hypothetical protein [Accumulibacter sp.]HMW57585.1 hypothetical protein [Accumulibacter sp.]